MLVLNKDKVVALRSPYGHLFDKALMISMA